MWRNYAKNTKWEVKKIWSQAKKENPLLPEPIETLYVMWLKRAKKVADLTPEQKHKMHARTMWGKETDTTAKLQWQLLIHRMSDRGGEHPQTIVQPRWKQPKWMSKVTFNLHNSQTKRINLSKLTSPELQPRQWTWRIQESNCQHEALMYGGRNMTNTMCSQKIMSQLNDKVITG
mgnify:CR=1 FL=1